eukprot:TRINITY_DN6191_c0_g2_i2.p1 TRINITY_DN6191_c0_g2~~TRINITY_DN6191_c0_g2_i2.p1  ORF type:complete len:293 (-),score=72.10 TRINITY_DN6191_c0_g2_i2:608-1486(-)
MSDLTEESLKKQTIATLKQHLRGRGLKLSGTKPQLIQRILDNCKSEVDKDEQKSDQPNVDELKSDQLDVDEKTEKHFKSKKKKRKASQLEDSDSVLPPKKMAKFVNFSHTITDPEWSKILEPLFEQPFFRKIEEFVSRERSSHKVYPPHEEVFATFNLTPFDQIKVVIIGQDPYFNPGQAEGLCFSVKKGVTIPPSLLRIYKVVKSQIEDFQIPNHGSLVEWARQGILMLNATLTVRDGEPNSHANCGWQDFTTEVMKYDLNLSVTTLFVLPPQPLFFLVQVKKYSFKYLKT